MNSTFLHSSHYLLDKSRSFSEESSFALSPAESMTSSSSSTCSSPPPASPLSEPPSPAAAWNSDNDEPTFKAATSAKKRTSAHLKPDDPVRAPYVNKKPKFATKYDEMLQPMSPTTYLPVESITLPAQARRSNYSAQSQKQFRLLLESKAKPADLEAFLGQHSEAVDVNEYNGEGRTALHECCFDGNLPTAKLLVRFGADARLTTREGFSTLHIAAFSGHSNLMLYIMSLRR